MGKDRKGKNMEEKATSGDMTGGSKEGKWMKKQFRGPPKYYQERMGSGQRRGPRFARGTWKGGLGVGKSCQPAQRQRGVQVKGNVDMEKGAIIGGELGVESR